jgi:hypothetical protein
MKSFITCLLLLGSFSVLADCPAEARKASSKYRVAKRVTSSIYREFYPGLRHYRALWSEYGFGNETRPFIERVEVLKKNRSITGYNVFITDGGDESTIRYLFNADKRLVVAYWYNQSPYTFWFCGASEPVSEEETLDDAEIW